MNGKLIISSFIIFLFALIYNAKAQYFGTNKPGYKKFEYELIKTPHFELYHYFKDSSIVAQLASSCEKWYFYHQQVLADTFKQRNPVLIYSNHADFQQTTAISGIINVGTGGVTEGLKRRIVLPVTFLADETNHVLGHEMVHAFQYHIITESEGLDIQAIRNVPLWMIEGMAEYLSIGSVSSNTCLWMRDAIIHHKFPTFLQLSRDPSYSPYRYGHAFWSFIVSEYGEQYVSKLFRYTAVYGYENAFEKLLNITQDSLSIRWKHELSKQLINQASDSIHTIIGTKLIHHGNSGRYNISPSISPDGKYIIFMSERDGYSLDLFVADAHTGKVIDRIYSKTRFDHIDALSFLETSGTWSVDSRLYAYTGYSKGKSVLFIFDVKKRIIIDEFVFESLDAIRSPTWHSDKDIIAFSGLKSGLSDIYTYDFKSKELKNLTSNKYSCIMPSWSRDGEDVYYTTDEPTKIQQQYHFGYTNLALIRTKSGKKEVYSTFDGAKNMNPISGIDDNEVLFLSDRNGRRNLYLYNTQSDDIYQITNYPTGIGGISEYSPSIAICQDTLIYNMIWDGNFNIYRTELTTLDKFKSRINNRKVDYNASRLSAYSQYPSMVETNLFFNRQPYHQQPDSFYKSTITPNFKLDYIGNMSGGIMVGRFGTGMAGSIEALFSDILGYHKLYSGLSINGEVYDFGGQVAYLNEKNRLKKGISYSHIPYRTGFMTKSSDTLTDGVIDKSNNYLLRRIFEDRFSTFAVYPFNQKRRIEFGLSFASFTYRDELLEDFYSYDQLYYNKRRRVSSPSGFQVGIFDAAYVIDNSKMGMASPVEGKRIRFQTEQYFGGMNITTGLIDIRKYFFIRPFSLAFRFYHFGRYGRESDNTRFAKLYIGYPWFVRGFESGNSYGDESIDSDKISFEQMMGSKIIVSNIEWRIPFTGPSQVALIQSGFLMSEVALFIDGGLAWDKDSNIDFRLTTKDPRNRIPVFGTGLGYRINLFGLIVIEPYYAYPIVQKKVGKTSFGINIFAGW